MSFVAVAIGSTVAGIGSSLIGASAQSSAASKAANATIQANRDNIEFQKWLYNDTKAMNEPWYQAGTTALGQIQQGITDGTFDIGQFMISPEYDPGKFTTTAKDPGTFQFDASKIQIDPGYQFRLNEGVKALDNSASGTGMVQSGAQAKAAMQYGQDMASQEYQNAYNREFQNQLTGYNSGVDQYNRQFTADQTAYNYNAQRANTLQNLGLTQYNSQVAQKQNNYNILSGLSNSGQSAAGANQQAAGTLSSQVGASTLNTGNALANMYTAQGNATANAVTGAATSVNQGLQNYMLYNMLKNKTAVG